MRASLLWESKILGLKPDRSPVGELRHNTILPHLRSGDVILCEEFSRQIHVAICAVRNRVSRGAGFRLAKTDFSRNAKPELGPMFHKCSRKLHAHSERCLTACSFYAVGDQAFDIHYIDASGNEIPFEQAVSSKKH